MTNDEPFHQPTEQYKSREYWDQLIKDEGLDVAIDRMHQMRAGPAAYAESSINNYLKIQGILRPERQEAREVETLEVAKSAKLASWIAVGVALAAVLVTIATCSHQ